MLAVDGKGGDFLSSRSRSLVPVVLLALLCLVGVAGVAGCGDSGASDEEIAAAEKRGEKKGRFYRMEKEKQRRLEKAIQEIREGQKKAVPAPAPGSTGGTDPTPPTERTSCGGTLEVGPDTTCEFAANVRSAYETEIVTGPGTVLAYSPANNEVYEMNCTAAPHECTGAISARVYFP